jgi:hypothetical protein
MRKLKREVRRSSKAVEGHLKDRAKTKARCEI